MQLTSQASIIDDTDFSLSYTQCSKQFVFWATDNTCFSNNLINVDHMTMIKVIPDLPNLEVVQRSSFSMNDFEMIFTKEMAGTAIKASSTYCLVAYDAPLRNRQCLP